MTTWVPCENELGLQPIATTSTTRQHPIGKVIRAFDNDGLYGEGEFIYLPGVANTVVGSVVTYNPEGFTYSGTTETAVGTTVLVPNTANLASPVAVAMSANVASQWGWYQIGGAAVIKKTAVKVNPAVALYISGTAGRLMSTAASGKQILGLRSVNTATVASATSTVVVVIDRPHCQGAVT